MSVVGLWCLAPLSCFNVSVISWRSVLLVEELGVPGDNLPPVIGKHYHIKFDQVHLAKSGIRIQNFSNDRH